MHMRNRNTAGYSNRLRSTSKLLRLPTLEQLEDRCVLSGGLSDVADMLMADPTTQKSIYNSFVDATTGFGYFSSSHSGAIVKVNLNGAQPVQVIDPSAYVAPGRLITGVVDTSSSDPSQHYLYFTTLQGLVLKLTPGDATHDPQLVASLQLTGLAANAFINASAIDSSSSDPTQHYVYFGVSSTAGDQVARVRLSDFSQQGIENVQAPGSLRFGAIDPVRHYLYFTAVNGQDPFILKVNVAAFPNGASTVLDLNNTNPGQGIARPGLPVPSFQSPPVIDVADNLIYVSTSTYDTSPGQINLNTWPYNQSLVARISPGTGDQWPANPVLSILNLQPGERDLASVGYDQADGDLIYGTDNTYPASVYRIHVGDGSQPMQEVGSLKLQLGNVSPVPQDGTSAVGNSVTTYGESFLLTGFFYGPKSAAYFGTDTTPGQVIEIGVSSSDSQSGPAAPTGLALAPGSDSGASASDGITNVTSPTVTGQGPAGATISLFDGATPLGATVANGNGSWSIQVGPLAQGVHTLTATASNSSGTSGPSAPLVVTILTTPPAAPAFDLDVSSDTAPAGDHATTLATVELTGQTTAGALVTLQPTGATVNADNTGTFHFLNIALALGGNAFTARASDVAGNLSGTFAITITRLTPPPPPPPPPPTSHKIVFVSTRTGTSNLFEMYADGTSPTNLTNNTAMNTMPAYTRDGTKIAFVSNLHGNLDIYTINPDGTGLKQLTSNAGSNMDPTFSNDDSKIAFESNRSGAYELYVMNADGSNLTQVTSTPGSNTMPSFNQNGTSVVFSSNMFNPSGSTLQVYSVNIDGTGLQRLTNDSFSDFFARYSPDGSHVVFESTRTGQTEIYTMSANGSNQAMLTSDAAGDMMPSYSPDGAQIVFVSLRDGNQEIYTMNADGSSQMRLTNNPGRDNYPSWDDVPRQYSGGLGAGKSGTSPAWLLHGNGATTELGFDRDTKMQDVPRHADDAVLVDSCHEALSADTTNLVDMAAGLMDGSTDDSLDDLFAGTAGDMWA
jgi:Tol biopolymer transport system component